MGGEERVRDLILGEGSLVLVDQGKKDRCDRGCAWWGSWVCPRRGDGEADLFIISRLDYGTESWG